MADRMNGVWLEAEIPSTTPVIVQMDGAPLPCTVTLVSADASRAIELSVDGGTEYFSPAVDYASATQQAVALTAPVSHVRITGAAGDSWRIQ